MQPKKRSVWRRLWARPASAVSLVLIGLTIFCAVFAYVLAPDNTPSANRMIIELSARPPGFSSRLLLVPRRIATAQHSGVHQFLFGKESSYQYIPFTEYSFSNDSITVRHYIDEGLSDTLHYALHELIPANNDPLDKQRAFIEKNRVIRKTFLLGTDRYGRDILSRLLVGARVSMSVGIVAVVLSMLIGILLGMLAGFYRGWVDNVVMWFVNVVWAIPTILLVFAITITIGKSFFEIFIAIGLTMWVGTARLVRGQVMSLREMDYVTAARALGLKNSRIMLRHILPNIAGPLMVIAAGNFATAILIEAGLSFLGIGVQPPQPSWGLMIKDHYNFLLTNRPFLAIIPGIAIMMLVYAFNILGNALRDIIDVRN